MSKRSYKQHCLLARTLDVVGERWTLLIVRDLLMGPKRYTDLATGLPGLGTNLLAERLKRLETEGLIERHVLPPPAASTVYRLTEIGAGLEPAIMALAFWGMRFMDRGTNEDLRRLAWPFLAIRELFVPERALGLDVTAAFEAEGEHVFVRVRASALETGSGEPPSPPDVGVVGSRSDLVTLLFGGLDLRQGIADGKLEVDGDIDALSAVLDCFRLGAARDLPIRAKNGTEADGH